MFIILHQLSKKGSKSQEHMGKGGKHASTFVYIYGISFFFFCSVGFQLWYLLEK